MFGAKVKSKKRGIKLKDIYDADKARKALLSEGKPKEDKLYMDRYRKAQEAMKNFKPIPRKKGG